MKPYASYKPSGVAWLGDVPEHWEVMPLRYLSRGVKTGGTPVQEAFVEKQSEHTVPWYAPADLRDFFLTESSRIVAAEHRSSIDVFAPGTIALVGIGDVGRVAMLTVEGTGNQQLNFIRPVDGIVSNFLTYALMAGQEFVRSRANVTLIPILNQENTKRLRFAVPPPDEQQAIANYLDTETERIDMLVQEKEELIGLLREARSNRISELISGDGLPGSATGNPWAPHLPEGWQLKRLKHLAQVRSGLAKGKDTGSNTTVELPYLRVANVQEGRLDLREISTMPVDVDAVERFSLLEGDVLMNEGGDYDKVGRGAVWTGEISPCLHQNHVFAVRPVQRDLSEWISAITQTQYAKFYFMNNAKQSTNLASISQASVKELPILLPPKEQRDALLEKLGGELAAFDALITHTQEEIALLKELRAATIADAVLGRVDVRSLNRKQ
jgi:type I restriction enzyme, S subunit